MITSPLKSFISRLLLLTLIMGPLHTAQANLYTHVTQELPSEYLTTHATKPAVLSPALEEQPKPTQQNFEIKPLSREQQRTIILRLFSEHNPSTSPELLDAAGRKDLELLNQANLHSIISRAETAFGDVALAKLLVEPTANVAEIQKRQSIIRTLCMDQGFMQDAQETLRCINDNAKIFLTFWEKSNAIEQGTIDGLYFGKILDSLNKNVFALGTRLRLQDFAFIGSIYGEAFRFFMLKQFGKQILQRNPKLQTYLPSDIGLNTEISLKALALSPITQVIDGYKIDNFVYEAAAQKALGHPLSSAAKARFKTLAVISGGIAILAGILERKVLFEGILQRKNIINNLQTNLINLTSGLNDLKKVSALLSEHHIDSFEAITDLFSDSNKHSAQLHQLLQLLNSNTFKGDASFFSLKGRVLRAHKLIHEVKDELLDAFEALGKFDALVSTAKLVKEFSDKRVTFCFAEFVPANTPYLELTEFWNPLVHPNVVVPNNVTLGQPVNTMILTGPNTGGKSTVIKGITLNIVLAQTFGIAAARSMKFTPFTKINTNINITDNVKENLSLFAAETARAKHVLNEMSSLQAKQFGFCVFDETFRGTSPDHAEKLSVWYAKELAKFKNIICLHATHYPSMVNLEHDAPSCKNYKVEIEKLPDGSLKRDYILREGFTLHNVAEDILKEQGLIK